MLNKADPDFKIILNEYDENGEKIVEHRFKSEQMYWEYYELLQAIKRMNRPKISEEEYQKVVQRSMRSLVENRKS